MRRRVNKTEVVQIRLTPAEKETLRELARKSDMTISDYIMCLVDWHYVFDGGTKPDWTDTLII